MVKVGAAGITAPTCPGCQRTVSLTHQIDGLRHCRRCYDLATNMPCSRCHQTKQAASRTAGGEPVCGACFRTDPVNHDLCTGCGRIAEVNRRGDQMLCRRCFRAPTATCSICGRDKPCHYADSDRPRCESCTRQMNRAPCARCGKTLAVWSRTTGGEPLCNTCCARREPCRDCGRTRILVGRLAAGEPLCVTCYGKNPISFRACGNCGVVERLHLHGLCVRCSSRQQLLALLGDVDTGELTPHTQPIFRVFADSDPGTVARWLTHSTARTVLGQVRARKQPMTHTALDDLEPNQAIEHLRKVLVAGGVLPPRDDYLANFERWVQRTLATVDDPQTRRVIRSFAVWHQLRRLRGRAQRRLITAGQVQRARAGVLTAVHLATWLHQQGLALATCTQADIDRWLAGSRTTAYHARPFVEWARRHGHADGIEIPEFQRGADPARIEEDQRWDLVRRLLHDATIAATDRVAGLLLVLFGQPLSRVARLTRDQVTGAAGNVRIMLGAHPLEVPSPIDELVLELAANPRGQAALARTDNHPWLFPGGFPAQPITAGSLALRLKKFGIQARTARSAALFDPAGRLPASVLAKLVGIHVNTAIRWTVRVRVGADTATYAAEVARRSQSRPETGGRR